MSFTRRHFLKRAVAVSAGFAGLRTVSGLCDLSLLGLAEAGTAGFGALESDPEGLLDLPPGFSYHVFSSFGEIMDDGFPVPAMQVLCVKR